MLDRTYITASALFVILLSLISNAMGQNFNMTDVVTNELLVNGNAESFEITIENTSDSTINTGTVTVNLPTGIRYVEGSLTEASSFDLTLVSTTPLTLSFNNLPNSGELTFNLSLEAFCDAISHQQTGGIFRNSVTVNSGAISETLVGNPYNVLYASLSILSIAPKNPSITSGTSYNQSLTIINGGNGSVDKIYIFYQLPPEITLTSTNLGTISGDTIIIRGSDFNSIGNGDGALNQDESFNISATLSGTSCVDKTVSGVVIAGWSETGGFCQQSSTNTNISIDYDNPNLSIETIESLNACLGVTPSEQMVKLTNNGIGTATNVLIDIFKSSGGDYDEDLLSAFDIASVSYRVGNTGSFSPLSTTNILETRSDGIYSCLGVSPKGAFTVSVPNMAPGEEIYIRWNMQTCCLSTCSEIEIGGWKTEISYSDACNVTNYTDSKTGQSPVGLHMTTFTETEPQIMNGEKARFNFIVDSYSNTLPQNDASIIVLQFEVQDGLTLENATDLNWVSRNTTWTPLSVIHDDISNLVTAKFATPAPFNIPKSEIQLDLLGDCSDEGAGPGPKNVTMTAGYIVDTNCVSTCEMQLACEKTVTTYLQCPDGNCAQGIRLISFEMNRINLGEVDNNDDGTPDASGTHDMSKVRTNRVMFGDTLEAHFTGRIHSSTSYPNFQHIYTESSMTQGEHLTPVKATIVIYDSSASTYRGGTGTVTRSVDGVNTVFKGDFSVPTLLANGATGLESFVYEKGDEIEIYIDYRVTGNIGGNVIEANTSNKVYASTTSNPSPLNQFGCHNHLENFTLIGYFFTVARQNNYTIRDCDRTVEQSFYLSIGSCCSNYNGGNLFPHEYRNWARVANAQVTIPNHYDAKNIRLIHYRTGGTNRTVTQSVTNITPDSISGGVTRYFELGQYFQDQGGSIQLSDDGFSGKIQMDLIPNCDIPMNTYQNLPWEFTFKTFENLGDSETETFEISPDRVRYIPTTMQLSSSNPNEDGLTKRVVWNISLRNPHNSAIDFGWIHLISPSGDVHVERVVEDNGNEISLDGDLYKVGDFSNREQRHFKIYATYSVCSPEKLFVYSGYSCEQYPTEYATFTCNKSSMVLNVNPKPAQTQVRIVGQTIGDECSPFVEVELQIASVQLGGIDSVFVTAEMPVNNSINIKNETSEYQYPLADSYTSLSDPLLNGRKYTFHVTNFERAMIENGIPGVTNIDSNKIKLRFQLELLSNFVPGQHVSFSIASERVCDENLPTINVDFDPILSFERTEIAGLTDIAQDNWSASWGDYNNDHYPDLFVTNYDANQPNSLFTNNGNGTFSKVTTGSIATELASSLAATWGDYNNDGYLDLFVANNLGYQNFLYTNNGDGSFTKNTSQPFSTDDAYGHGSLWADFNNDGYLDLFISDYMPTKPNLLYVNNGDGSFTKNTSSTIALGAAHSIGASTADIDGDGDLDLFVPNDGENNFLYRNDGNFEFTRLTGSAVSSETNKSVGSSWADSDNDGDLDLFVANAGDQNNRLYINNGSGTFTLSGGLISNDGGDSHGSTWSDMDNDGDLDLFVTNDRNTANRLYTNNGNGTFSVFQSGLLEDLENSFGTAAADIDQDGDMDLFVANHTSQENSIYVNGRASCQNHLCIKLLGINSNKNAVGAKIFVTASMYGNTITQMREITSQSGGGTGGQNDYQQVFGLGNANSIDEVRIMWPSGITQILSNPQLNNCYDVIEQDGVNVTGVIYNDINGNCTHDLNEEGLANQRLFIPELNKWITTNEQGIYSIYAPDGNYTLQASSDHWNTECGDVTLTVTGNEGSISNDIGMRNTCASNDLSIDLSAADMRRGFASELYINVRNHGAYTATNVHVGLSIPLGIDFVNASFTEDYVTVDSVAWVIPSIAPEQVFSIIMKDSTTLALSIDDAISFSGYVNNEFNDDCDVSDNSVLFNTVIVGAVDPNDKRIFFSDGSQRNYLAEGETVTYQIRFENIGTYYASRVIIIDTLHEALDIQSVQNIISSHEFEVSLQARTLIWTFNNINLPTNEEDSIGCHGFVQFDVLVNGDENVGESITNTAYIQFDFEDFIATNRVENRHLLTLPQTQHTTLNVFPNPALDFAHLDLDLESRDMIKQIRITDILGQDVTPKNIEAEQLYSLDLSLLAEGSYHLTVELIDGRTLSSPFIKK